MTVIVDYGVGNLQSVARAFEAVGAPCRISDRPREVARAERLVLPGVGSFGAAMGRLEACGLRGPLEQRVLGERVPLLGICLGFQLLTRGSEEGAVAGLGWFDAETRRFPDPEDDPSYRVPHLGWSPLELLRPSPLLPGSEPPPCFYFAHSYYVAPSDPTTVLARGHHGVGFAAVLQRDNLVGVQFHPEKSHANGLALIRAFSTWRGGADDA